MSGQYGRALTVVATAGSAIAAAILFAVALVKSRRSGATSKTTRPVGEHAGAAELSGSGVPR